MTALALVLLSLAIADLIAGGLPARPRAWRTGLLGFIAAIVMCSASGWVLALQHSPSLVLLVGIGTGF